MNPIKQHLRYYTLFFFIVLIAASCKNEKKVAPPPPTIQVVEVIQKDVPIYETFVGQTYGYSDIPIRTRVAGFLTGIHFQEGHFVKKGQLLYTVDPQEYAEKVSAQKSYLAQAETELSKAKSDLDRIVPLAKINAVSKSDLDAAQAAYNAALSYVDAMKANLRFAEINYGYCWIKSPINGQIGKTNARVGEFVGQNPNPVILNTVSTIDTIRVEFFLPEADYLRFAREYKALKDDRTAKAGNSETRNNVSLILADGSTFKHKGYVNFVNREVDPQTGSMLVQTTFPNPERLLRPGQYSKVVVKMEEVKGALLVPQRCIVELQGQHSVFVVNSDSIVESKQIVTGEKIGDMQIVTKGLNSGDRVVIDALQKVSSGLKVKPEITQFKSQTSSQY